MLNLIEKDECVGLVAQLSAGNHAKSQIEIFDSSYVTEQTFCFVVFDEVYFDEVLEQSFPDFAYYV